MKLKKNSTYLKVQRFSVVLRDYKQGTVYSMCPIHPEDQ